jgi:hypothetical protein
MTPEKDKALTTTYPLIFGTDCLRFGFECGDGWFDIIDSLCSLLMIESEMTEGVVPPRATQVKEKFGTLRFYVDQASDYQYKLIERAERMSKTTCEVCGEPGALDGSRSWIKTLCDEHRK